MLNASSRNDGSRLVWTEGGWPKQPTLHRYPRFTDEPLDLTSYKNFKETSFLMREVPGFGR